MKVNVTAGCGQPRFCGAGGCETHEEHVDFDGFTLNWHVYQHPAPLRGREMWRNGPSIRPTR